MRRAVVRGLVGLAAAALLAGCEGQDNTSQGRDEAYNESNQQKMIRAVPPPELSTSQERKNLVRRYASFNHENKISYIYLLTEMGQVIKFFPVKGKVSSVNSLLTCPEKIVRVWDRQGVAVSAPQPDGSYGTNGAAVFFYTTEDVYVEWNGKYLLVDQPLQLTTKPLLIDQVAGGKR